MPNKEKQFNAAMFDLLKHDEDKLADFILAEQSLSQMIADTVVEFETGPFKCSAGLEWVEEDCIFIDFTTIELEEDSTNGGTFDTMRWSNPELYGSMSESELFGEYVGMTVFETGNLMKKIQDTGLIDAAIDFNKRLDEFALELYANSEDFRMAYDSWVADRLESYSASQILTRIRRGVTHELVFFMYRCDFIHEKAVVWAGAHRAKTDAAALFEPHSSDHPTGPTMSDDTKFRFRLNVDSTLTIDQIWPDGDAPENPTVEDVARVTGQWDSAKISVREMCELVDEWNLYVDGEASIDKVADDRTPARREDAMLDERDHTEPVCECVRDDVSQPARCCN